MQKLIYITLLALSFSAFAGELEDVKTCLNNWGEHPFKEAKLKYRIISSKVKVMGIGGEMAEEKSTKSPELVLVKPNVNVMTKNIIKLSNPNGGWRPRKFIGYVEGGDTGNREQHISKLIHQMV